MVIKILRLIVNRLSITQDGSGYLTHADGYVTFKVAKLPVTLTFKVSPFVSGRLANETGMISSCED